MESPDMSITNHIWTVVIDTTGAAQIMSNHFDDVSQADCAMHDCKLLLKCSMGIKDNHVADPYQCLGHKVWLILRQTRL
eukprot:8790398-Ditylum_brightwellii.AAC.1